jgi:hypothetical protein
MNKDKKKIKLPEDCSLLSINACTSKKVRGKCKVDSSFLGLKSKCVPNENYETDKFLVEKGFKNFSKINEDNLEEELALRNELCEKLSAEKGGACESLNARAIGCTVKSSFFGKKRCGLSDDIVNFFYRKRKDCVAKDCDKPRRKYSTLCDEHYAEINEVLQEYKSYYQDIVFAKKRRKDDLLYFNDLYDYMFDVYSVYLLDKANILNSVEEMKLRVDTFIGQDQCQAYNISKCIGNGKVHQRCKNKGYKTKEGIFCKIHISCYDERIKKYKYFRDNFEKLCEQEVCMSKLGDLRQFWEMIRFTSEGEANEVKFDVLETIEIVEEYNKL